MPGTVIAIGVTAVLVGAVVAKYIHAGYAWRNYRGARAAVPIARRAWWARFTAFMGTALFVVIVVSLVVYMATHPEER